MRVWSLPKRLEEINRIKKGPSRGTYPLFFRGKLENYPIYSVQIEMPVYRLSNGRTLARQREYIAKNKKNKDFFSKDPESIEAISAQDEILRDMARDEGLYEYFRKPQTIQDQPLVLDENGYIINGNRRICAMCMLLEKDYESYTKYQYVNVIFLTKCNEEDILKLEAQLQTQPDIKAEYSWIAEALLFKNQMDIYDYNYKVLERIHLKDKSEIQELIDMIDYADEYLISREKEYYYSLVEKHQLAFNQLRKFRRKFRDPQDQELFKELVFQFIDDPEDSPGRLYQTVKDIADHLPQIKKTLVTEHDIKPIDDTEESDIDEDISILEPVTETIETDASNLNEEIIEFIKESNDPHEIRDQVISTIILSKKHEREKKSKNAFRQNLQNAYSNLLDAKTCYSSDSDIEGALKFLENIIDLVKEIKGMIK